ncbi:MAG: type II toxin-antitoxin system HigB family toxin [Candidatus Aminicenantes bacterium]
MTFYWELYIILMRVISKNELIEFYKKHAETKSPLEAWYHEFKRENWSNPMDVINKYGSARPIKENRVVFNIKGNKYRLVVKINYELKIIRIRFIGTHKEYDKINAEEI